MRRIPHTETSLHKRNAKHSWKTPLSILRQNIKSLGLGLTTICSISGMKFPSSVNTFWKKLRRICNSQRGKPVSFTSEAFCQNTCTELLFANLGHRPRVSFITENGSRGKEKACICRNCRKSGLVRFRLLLCRVGDAPNKGHRQKRTGHRNVILLFPVPESPFSRSC